jgi:hypothetical protein
MRRRDLRFGDDPALPFLICHPFRYYSYGVDVPSSQKPARCFPRLV